jgi:hypothetical protein
MENTFNPLKATENVISLIDATFVADALIRGTDISASVNTFSTENPAACGGVKLDSKGSNFYRSDTKATVKTATVVEIHPGGTVWAWGVNEDAYFTDNS